VDFESKLPNQVVSIFTVMSRLAQETGAINLGQGFPDFFIDERLIDAVHRAMRDGQNQYAPMAGLPALREALCAKANTLYGHAYDEATEVTITAGATQAIFTAIQAVVSEGDEVIIIDPAYDCYAPAVRLCGGNPVHVNLNGDMSFNLEAVRRAVTSRTKLLMINTPHNPGGRILRDADMRGLEELLRNTNVLLLSDEVYEHLVFDGEEHASAIRYKSLRERAFITFSFGKVFHATGWKMGYVFAPEHLMKEFRKVHQYNVFSVNSAMQCGLAEYLKDAAPYMGLSAFFQPKRDLFLKGLEASRFTPLRCEGSYFMVADYSAVSDMDDVEFAKWLTVEHGVACIPLSPFYKDAPKGQRLVRFCFAKKENTLLKALDLLQQV